MSKNPAYKSVNSSSMRFVEEPPIVKVETKEEMPETKKVLPEKNPAYKNINCSSMMYIDSSTQTFETNNVTVQKSGLHPANSYNYCTIH